MPREHNVLSGPVPKTELIIKPITIAPIVTQSENFKAEINNLAPTFLYSMQIIDKKEQQNVIGTPSFGSQTVSIVTKNMNIIFQYTAKNRSVINPTKENKTPNIKSTKVPLND
ncbi:hypothetical protein N475_13895 [Pseudoalteromonas luteoviolacea DSM 6061]|uniref:Uncharacterized protein n=1 Tax=Pseudoalteromonas luteoviolacea DSM 6061 TaxID=1365250 RepID=A0A166X9R3_9GAMM|nr:hypothetical protein N475_13895 [Pseudoalteromonas luteoviolacea DSM 6061]MBE0385785.1 hypothetical protein [Pseudoalteromonas luteoviolacea DSM 6061]